MSDGTDVFFVEDDGFLSEDEILNELSDEKPSGQREEKKAFTPPTSNPDSDNRDFKADIYKKWFKTKDKSGFLALRGWLEAGKISFDIGEIVGGTSKNTLVWADAIEIAAFLRAVSNGTGKLAYPKTRDIEVPEGLSVYGGGRHAGEPISRILKITYWKGGGQYDESAFVFKCGHFKARESSSGAFIPDMKSPLSMNQIKVTRAEIAQMSYRLDLALHSFAAQHNGDIFKALNGESR